MLLHLQFNMNKQHELKLNTCGRKSSFALSPETKFTTAAFEF
jgi:hypothetical protein